MDIASKNTTTRHQNLWKKHDIETEITTPNQKPYNFSFHSIFGAKKVGILIAFNKQETN